MDKNQDNLNKISPALKYWQNELATRDEATKNLYLRSFEKFLEFSGKSPDELIQERQIDQMNPDLKVKRRMESLLIRFIAQKREEGYAIATLQIYFACVRSFFEIHYYPLVMRKGDYPKGESFGVRRATKEAIYKAIENSNSRNKTMIKAPSGRPTPQLALKFSLTFRAENFKD